MESRVASLKASCADNASTYPDASRKNNASGNANKCDDFESNEAKKRAVESTEEENHTNHSSKLSLESRDSQDTGGSDDSSLGKNSGKLLLFDHASSQFFQAAYRCFLIFFPGADVSNSTALS